ncbi:hypothetical protein BV25DRAFT_1831656 [Artomyces pyxidatus]|uniref:Uncharacterized protein n=1 Tax=Artomyces pyxidatus TaxID=48021 RepID=A0ACB8SKN0_9AGAM|nr:hypothetical protein BV25DRAFT_1831656 [Artomyces pyxidatus]
MAYDDEFPYSSGHRVTKPAERAMAADLHRKVVGPMAVETFLDTFLPLKPDRSAAVASTMTSVDVVENAAAPKPVRRRSPAARTSPTTRTSPRSPITRTSPRSSTTRTSPRSTATRTSPRSSATRTSPRSSATHLSLHSSISHTSPAASSSASPRRSTKAQGGRQFDDVSAAPTEALMYEPFIEACKRIAPGLEFINSSHSGDPECQLSGDALKPDVVVYAPHSGRTRDSDFSRLEMHIEFKYNSFGDPFQDPVFVDAVGFANRRSQSFEKVGCEMAADTCGQIAAYASAQMYRQFRTHCFSVLIVGNRARLIRWDHAGAVATVAFHYVLEPHLLVDFFQRYAQASDAVRGKDRTVRDATPEERRAAEEHLGPSDRYFAIEVAVPFTDPETKETIPVRTLIVAAPRYSTHSLLGRSTRGMVAFDMTSKRKVFLKDTWRIDSPDFAPEGETYKILQAAKVKNIAKFIGACDVSDTESGEHATLTQVYARMPWACKTQDMVRYRHYRLMLETIGKPVWTFKSSYQLFSVVWDAIEGHSGAYEAGILHCDVSVGNILIGPDGCGLLIDWDLATSVAELNMPGRQREMTGTWQFCSAAMLLKPGTHRHVLADDLESFVHVCAWLALRYCRHSLDAEDLGLLLYEYFDRCSMNSDVGGYGKEFTILRGGFHPEPNFTQSTLLNDLFPALFFPFVVRYKSPPISLKFMRPDPTRITPEEYQIWRDELMPRLESHEWMLELGKEALSYTDEWPLDDYAQEQPFVSFKPTAQKRESERESAHYPVKRSRYH